jgi:undecaprenyl-phosphate galactose phosphotransferase
MSLVGPRPIIDSHDYDREYIHEHPEVFDMYQMVRPGVTGLWQISGRNLLPYKQRVSLDRFYLHNWSVSLDMYILWRTLKTALLREGAY